MEYRFGTALNCIDGRTQIPVITWMRRNFDIDYVDMITEPGMDKVLIYGRPAEIARLRENVETSISAHKSNIVAVAGHYDCAANPVSAYEHIEDIRSSVDTVKSWGLPVRVVGLWVDSFWRVQAVTR